MITLLNAVSSSGASAPIALAERLRHYTIIATPSNDFSGSASIFAQIAASTGGPWANVTTAMSLSSTEACDFKNIAEGVYVAIRAYMTTAPSVGSVTVQLFDDR